MPTFAYSEFDGTQQFEPLRGDAAFDKLSEYLMQYGDPVLRHLEQSADEDAEVLEMLLKHGYLEKDENGQFTISPKGARRMEEKALGDLFHAPNRDGVGKHETQHKGAGQVRHEDSKPYEYGDPVANLNLHETLKNAFLRQERAEGQGTSGSQSEGQGTLFPPSYEGGARGGLKGPGPRLRVTEEDFVVYETEYQTSCATVLLIDMSGSMARYGKYYHAKKVALALLGLVRGRFPEDSFECLGFYTYATPLNERALIRSAPKPVSIYDSRVHLRVNLEKPPHFVPEHFTNIQAGLRFARNSLKRKPARNKQIICITDGEPTAHIEGREIFLIYPPSERTARATLEEVHRCTNEGIHLSTFALVEDPYYFGLVNFVERMARESKGIAAYCQAGELGGYVLDSFLKGHRSRKFVG